MSARRLLPRTYTTAQADKFVDEMRKAGMILADGTLAGPADRYSASEIWCYIFHLWSKHKDSSQLFANMSTPYQDMDSARACDVVTATVATRAGDTDRELASTASELTPKHLFLFLKLVGGSVPPRVPL